MLFPGQDPPAIALQALDHPDVQGHPGLARGDPVFDKCTATLSHSDEVAARDSYWRATLGQNDLGWEQQLELDTATTSLNPFVGEPHLMIAQLHFRRHDYTGAANHAKASLERFFAPATAWDKRRSVVAWIAFARMLLMRAHRLGDGLPDLPYDMGPDRVQGPAASGGPDAADDSRHRHRYGCSSSVVGGRGDSGRWCDPKVNSTLPRGRTISEWKMTINPSPRPRATDILRSINTSKLGKFGKFPATIKTRCT